MVHAARGHGAEVVRAVATSAVREASDAWVFVDAVRAACGVEVEVITGHEEGRLAFVGAARAFDLRKGASAVLDVGGGSSELVMAEHGKIRRIISWPVGAVRLTERFGGPALAPTEGYKEMLASLRQMSASERARVPGLSRDRSEIIVAGVLTVHRVMKALGCKRVLIHSGSIRDGVLAEMFAR